jgi:hypothetical protein
VKEKKKKAQRFYSLRVTTPCRRLNRNKEKNSPHPNSEIHPKKYTIEEEKSTALSKTGDSCHELLFLSHTGQSSSNG